MYGFASPSLTAIKRLLRFLVTKHSKSRFFVKFFKGTEAHCPQVSTTISREQAKPTIHTGKLSIMGTS